MFASAKENMFASAPSNGNPDNSLLTTHTNKGQGGS